MKLLLAVSVPSTENPDEVLQQLLLSQHQTITVTVDQGVTFDLGLDDIERIGVYA